MPALCAGVRFLAASADSKGAVNFSLKGGMHVGRIRNGLTSAHVLATIALFVGLAGTAGAGGITLITGSTIRDGSVGGIDVRNGSITGLDVRDGSLRIEDLARHDQSKLIGRKGVRGAVGLKGDTGPAGAKGEIGAKGDTGPAGAPATLPSFDATAPDITNYQDLTPIVTATAPAAGYYLAIASGTVTNTGGSDDYLNCGFDVAGTIAGAAGFQTTAGNATSGSSVTVAPITAANQPVTFVCDGNGATTFDLSNLKLKLVQLADA